LAKKLVAAGVLLLALQLPLFAAQPAGTTALGVRLGLLRNNESELKNPNNEVKLFGNKTNFYVEGMFNYYFTNFLAGVLNFGSYSKGDITFEIYINDVFDGRFVGQASIYPIQAGIKLTPFSVQFPGKAKPYIEGGGAFVVGRETATLGPYDSYWARYTDGSLSSETDWTWWGGGGVEIPLSESLQFDIMVKYMDTKFSGDIAGISNYSGVQFSLGIMYLTLSK
jgi:hypothetical protein